MSSLSTKSNKSRSTPSRLQAKAASKTSVKKAAVGKKAPAKAAPAKAGKSAARAAKSPSAKKAGAAHAVGKTSARTAVKPSASKKPAKKSAHKTAPQVETRTAELPAKKTYALEARAALEAFEKALKLFNKQDFATAKEAFEKILTNFNNQTEIVASVRTYLIIAEQRLARTPSLPKSPDALYDRGVFEFNKANFQEAINLFEKALKTQPQAAHVLYSLAAAYARVNNTKKAIEALRRATDVQSSLRSRARSDQDFASLHSNEDFRFMTGFGFDFQE